MLKQLLLAILLSLSVTTIAQIDGSQVYDRVYLKNGKVLTGTIIIFQESDGDITFKDLKGRMYSITRKEYKYFREKVVYITGSDTTIVNQRKYDVYGISIGGFIGSHLSDITGSIYLAGGKYLGRENYIGMSIEYALGSDNLETFFSPKVFIKHQYDAYKRNISSYIISEMGYAYGKGDLIVDLYSPTEAMEFRLYQEADFISVGLGNGFGFYLKNTNYISVDLIFNRQIALNRDILSIDTDIGGFDLNLTKSNPSYNSVGLRILINL